MTDLVAERVMAQPAHETDQGVGCAGSGVKRLQSSADDMEFSIKPFLCIIG